MATGSLIKIDEEIVTSAVASVTLTGIDSTYDVYMVRLNNVVQSTNTGTFDIRVTKGGINDNSSNYDSARKLLYANGAFSNQTETNQNRWDIELIGTTSTSNGNFIFYLFNFNSSTEYSFITIEETTFNSNGDFFGNTGGGVHTVASASDGLYFFNDASNQIESGTFTLYGLKK